MKTIGLSVVSGFRREVAESCALLGYYAASTSTLRNSPEQLSSQYNIKAAF